jgi:hypothetical protein
VPLYLRLNTAAEFRLNYECEPGGSVRAAVSGAAGRSLEEAVPLTGQSFSSPLAWSSGTRIEPGEDGLTLIVLHLDRAAIYAFEVVPGSARGLKEGI